MASPRGDALPAPSPHNKQPRVLTEDSPHPLPPGIELAAYRLDARERDRAPADRHP